MPQPTDTPNWRETLDSAIFALGLAQSYAKGGAFIRAAENAEKAAVLFRQAREEIKSEIERGEG
jgi:hypothetical protein